MSVSSRRLDKEPHPLPAETVSIVADEIVAWLATPRGQERIPTRGSPTCSASASATFARSYIVVNPHLPQEEVAIRAYAELQRRGWDLATYDPEVAQAASRRMQSLESRSRKGALTIEKTFVVGDKPAGVNRKVIGNPKIAAS